MSSYLLENAATALNFDEAGYLEANPDVAAQVRTGGLRSGRQHFDARGHKEGRRIALDRSRLAQIQKLKREAIQPLLREDMPSRETETCIDFLTDELRARFDIVDTAAVSSNGYDGRIQNLIAEYEGGIVLDCGAGKRPVYYDNVVNFEIVDYVTTDVRGVGEVLPFKDGSFDAVISIAVLEHVKDPFACASEIVRVLKPGGVVACSVPFLQPVHAYPHHYYNMTSQGLVNLFGEEMTVEQTDVYETLLPVYTLSWFLQSWADGLDGAALRKFKRMRVGDLMGRAQELVGEPFVTQLPDEKNFELACGTFLLARKSSA